LRKVLRLPTSALVYKLGAISELEPLLSRACGGAISPGSWTLRRVANAEFDVALCIANSVLETRGVVKTRSAVVGLPRRGFAPGPSPHKTGRLKILPFRGP